jgi:hypothetical protein
MMGWSGALQIYYARDSKCQFINKEIKPLFQEKGFSTSTKAFGSEFWYIKDSKPLAMGVMLVKKHIEGVGADFSTKMIDWDMGPYCSTNPPLKFLKRWAPAYLESLGIKELEDAASLINHKESFVAAWASACLEAGELLDTTSYIKDNYKRYKDFGLQSGK